MADEMILSGAYFDNNMPKWATEETLKRIERMLMQNRTTDKRHRDLVVKLLGRIAQNSGGSQSSKLSDQKMLAELKKITSSIDKLTKATEQTSKQTKTTRKTTTTTTDSYNNNAISDKMVDYAKTGNELLAKIHNEIKNISVDGVMSGREFGGGKQAKQTRRGFDTARINAQQASKKHDADIYTEDAKGLAGKFTEERKRTLGVLGKLRSGFDSVNGRIEKLVGGLRGFIGIVTRVTAVVGALATGLVAANKYVWEAQQQYRQLLTEGFSFGVEAIRKGIKMDGIKLRRTITEAGLVVEDGLKVLKDNAALVNKTGVAQFFQTIDKVAGDPRKLDSFVNQMMMTKEQIAEYTSRYLGSLQFAGALHRFTANEQSRYAQRFIKDAKEMGQVLGVGIERISENLRELESRPETALKYATLSEEQIGNFKTTQAALASLNLPSNVMSLLQNAMYDVTGAGIYGQEGGASFMAGAGRLVGSENAGIIQELIKKGSQGELGRTELVNLFDELRAGIEKSGMNIDEAKALLASGDDGQKAIASLITRFQAMSEETLEQMRRGDTDQQTSTILAQEQTRVEEAIYRLRATAGEQAARLADTDEARAAAYASYQTMLTGTQVVESGIKAITTAVVEFLPRISDTIDYISGLVKRVLETLGIDNVKETPAEKRARLEREKARRETAITLRQIQNKQSGGIATGVKGQKITVDALGNARQLKKDLANITEDTKKKDMLEKLTTAKFYSEYTGKNSLDERQRERLARDYKRTIMRLEEEGVEIEGEVSKKVKEKMSALDTESKPAKAKEPTMEGNNIKNGVEQVTKEAQQRQEEEQKRRDEERQKQQEEEKRKQEAQSTFSDYRGNPNGNVVDNTENNENINKTTTVMMANKDEEIEMLNFMKKIYYEMIGRNGV